jgi:hypothetical protein
VVTSSLHSLFQWLHETALAAQIRQNEVLFPWIECVHVLAVTLVVGSISIVDLRLLGLASLNRPVTALVREVLPFTWSVFAVAALTGATLFSSHATGYAGNFPFQMKMSLLVLAGVNMLGFHLLTYRSVASWNDARMTPWTAKLAGAVSLLLWIGVVTCGRWIGFTDVK